MSNLTGNIRTLRTLRNIKSEDMAKSLGMSKGNYSNIENDIHKHISDELLERIATVLGVTPDFIKNFNTNQVFEHVQNSQIANSVATQNLYTNETVLNELVNQLKVKDEQLKSKDEQITKLMGLISKSQK